MPNNAQAFTTYVAALADVIAANDSTVTSQEVAKILTDSLLIADVLATHYFGDGAASFDMQTALALTAQLRSQVRDQLSVEDRHTATFWLNAPTSDTAEMGDAPSLAALIHHTLRDGVAFLGRLPLADEDYTVWAFNAATMAASEYRGAPLQSVVSHRGRTFGVNGDGLYELAGGTDDGAAIDAMIRTGLTDLGLPGRKGVRRAYLYVKSEQLVYLKAVYDNDGARNEIWYQLAASPNDTLRDRWVDVGRGAKGIRWAFEVSNFDGGELDIRGLDVVPVVLARRQR